MSQLNENTTNLQDILNTINELPEAVSVDTALSDTSTNPVQNKIVTEALNGKADSSHTQSASTITAGTFAGAVVAQTTAQAPNTALIRNSKLVTTETTPSNNGEICWTYE